MEEERAKCTEACNNDGYCCDNQSGGCQRPTCSMGCLFAWFADTIADCEAECEAVSGCSHKHGASGIDLNLCGGHVGCGCPATNPSGLGVWGDKNDCSGQGCPAGCATAATIAATTFYGEPSALRCFAFSTITAWPRSAAYNELCTP
jgi:hypothetical protein